jgi:hypothetical protein
MIYAYKRYIVRVTAPLDANSPAQVFCSRVLCK